jgi:hypothetical protein
MSSGRFTAFHFWIGHRKKLIYEHEFYVTQAKERLFAQFAEEDLKKAANDHAQSTWEEMGQYFDPDRHDEGDFADTAYEAGIDLFLRLAEMRHDIRLSMLAAIYHQWEKELKDWLVREVGHWDRSESLKKRLWSATFVEILNLLKDIGLNVRAKPYYKTMDGARLVVNVYKHGEGTSLADLKKHYPHFLQVSVGSNSLDRLDLELRDHTDLEFCLQHFDEVAAAISSFWRDIPEYVSSNQIHNLPKWFKDASTVVK